MEPHHPRHTLTSVPHRQPLLTVVMTCKGRLEQLQQSLPLLARQDGMALVLVDYDCPQQSGDWVAQYHPQVQVVRGPIGTPFQIAHARNLGAAQARTPWLAFVDADILVGPTFGRDITLQLHEGCFLQADPCPPELCGLVVCHRDDFLQIGGYDEVFQGWGTEDRDLYARLERLGRQRRPFAAGDLRALPHSDAQRTRFHAVSDRFVSLRINGMYFQIKHDLARLSGLPDLPEQDRRTLYDQVRTMVLARPAEPCQIDARLPARCDFLQPPDWRLRRTIRYRFEPLEQTSP